MPEFRYEVVDVFTTTRFGGNQLAVILDGRGLSDQQMQQIAAEFNFSETTFVFPPADPNNTAQVRIFTQTVEVPFAGHPNVGTAFVLARQGEVFGQKIGDQMRFEEKAGLVDVQVVREQGIVTGAAITAPKRLEVGIEVSAEIVASCASLAPDEIVATNHTPHVISVGLYFVAAEVSSREALAKAQPDLAAFQQSLPITKLDYGRFSLFLYTRTPDGPTQISARMFAPLSNTYEDPATGSASGALASYLLQLDPASDGDLELQLEQGVDMGRPSLIELRAHKAAGEVEYVVIGGSSVPVMAGVITL